MGKELLKWSTPTLFLAATLMFNLTVDQAAAEKQAVRTRSIEAKYAAIQEVNRTREVNEQKVQTMADFKASLTQAKIDAKQVLAGLQ